MREIICIQCPKGCHLQVEENGAHEVRGNGCPRGAAYGKSELLHPVRTLTSTVAIAGAAHPRLPVKTDGPIPKEQIMACMKLLETIRVTSPVKTGTVLVPDILQTGANLIATKSM